MAVSHLFRTKIAKCFVARPERKTNHFQVPDSISARKKHAHTTNEVAQVEEDERTAAAKAKKNPISRNTQVVNTS